MAKLLEYTLSGSYRNSNAEIVDFDGVKVVVPKNAEDVCFMHIKTRYAVQAVSADPRYSKERAGRIRQLFVDNVKEVDGELSFAGKNLKELSEREMQDLATFYDLRGIPLPTRQSGFSLREMRVRAYAEYVERVQKGKRVQWREGKFDFAKAANIILEGGAAAAPRVEKEGKITNEQIIQKEQETTTTSDDPAERFTLAELKQLADENKISYDDETATVKELYARLFNS